MQVVSEAQVSAASEDTGEVADHNIGCETGVVEASEVNKATCTT